MLRCYLGMALAKVGKAGEALGCLGEAIAADPANPLAKFERAGVLLGLERFQDALAELEALRVRPMLTLYLPYACHSPSLCLPYTSTSWACRLGGQGRADRGAKSCLEARADVWQTRCGPVLDILVIDR